MNVLRILTLNIWNRQGSWDRRAPLIRSAIERLSPDVIGLQEVISHHGRSQADEIAESLGYEAAFGIAHDLGDDRHFGNAVLSRFPITSCRAIPLPVGDLDENRSLVFAQIASPHGVIPFFVTHLNWKFDHGIAREKQVVAIASHVDAVAPRSRLPVILTGDFNAEPDAAEIRFLKGLQSLDGRSTFFADCFALSGKGPGFTYDATRNPFAAPTREPPRRIDYIFARGPDEAIREVPIQARVVMDEVHGDVAASDHYGVYAEIAI